jgi:hypothetical protein
MFGAESTRGLEGMKAILADRENPEFPICRGYAKGIDFLVGTVASVIYDLKKRELHIARGQGATTGHWFTLPLDG